MRQILTKFYRIFPNPADSLSRNQGLWTHFLKWYNIQFITFVALYKWTLTTRRPIIGIAILSRRVTFKFHFIPSTKSYDLKPRYILSLLK